MKFYCILLIILVSPLTAFPQKVFHQKSTFNSYARGQDLMSKGKQYFILPTLEAREDSSASQTSVQSQQSQTSSSAILARKGSFLVSEKQTNLQNPQTGSTPDKYPVVFNPDSQQIGIVLGNLVAKMEDVNQAEPLISKYGLASVVKYPSMKLAIFKGKYPSQVLEIIDALQQEISITSAEIEVLEDLKRPL